VKWCTYTPHIRRNWYKTADFVTVQNMKKNN